MHGWNGIHNSNYPSIFAACLPNKIHAPSTSVGHADNASMRHDWCVFCRPRRILSLLCFGASKRCPTVAPCGWMSLDLIVRADMPRPVGTASIVVGYCGWLLTNWQKKWWRRGRRRYRLGAILSVFEIRGSHYSCSLFPIPYFLYGQC